MGACESPSLIMGTVPYQIRNHQSNIIMVSNPATAPIDATPISRSRKSAISYSRRISISLGPGMGLGPVLPILELSLVDLLPQSISFSGVTDVGSRRRFFAGAGPQRPPGPLRADDDA